MSVRVVACVTSRVLVDDVPGVWLVELVAGVLGDGLAFGSGFDDCLTLYWWISSWSSGNVMLRSFAIRVFWALMISITLSPSTESSRILFQVSSMIFWDVLDVEIGLSFCVFCVFGSDGLRGEVVVVVAVEDAAPVEG